MCGHRGVYVPLGLHTRGCPYTSCPGFGPPPRSGAQLVTSATSLRPQFIPKCPPPPTTSPRRLAPFLGDSKPFGPQQRNSEPTQVWFPERRGPEPGGDGGRRVFRGLQALWAPPPSAVSKFPAHPQRGMECSPESQRAACGWWGRRTGLLLDPGSPRAGEKG